MYSHMKLLLNLVRIHIHVYNNKVYTNVNGSFLLSQLAQVRYHMTG